MPRTSLQEAAYTLPAIFFMFTVLPLFLLARCIVRFAAGPKRREALATSLNVALNAMVLAWGDWMALYFFSGLAAGRNGEPYLTAAFLRCSREWGPMVFLIVPLTMAAYIYRRLRRSKGAIAHLFTQARWAFLFPAVAAATVCVKSSRYWTGWYSWDLERTIAMGIFLGALAFTWPSIPVGLRPRLWKGAWQASLVPAIPSGVTLGPALVETSTAACGVCGDPIGAAFVLCHDCGTPHHRACWEYFGRCSIYSCDCNRSEAAP